MDSYWFPKRLLVVRNSETLVSCELPEQFYPFKSKAADPESHHEENLAKWIEINYIGITQPMYAGVQDMKVIYRVA